MANMGLLLASALGKGLGAGVDSYQAAEKLRQEREQAAADQQARKTGLLLQAAAAGYDLSPEGKLTETPMSIEDRAMKKRLTESQIAENNANARSKKAESTGGKQLPPATVLAVSEGAQMPDLMRNLENTVSGNKKLFGPVENLGDKLFGVTNPYNADKIKVDNQMMVAAQMVGKYMEGGKLQKEDEKKYRRMLPNLSDTPEAAQIKINNVKEMLANKSKTDVGSLKTAGYKTDGLLNESMDSGVTEERRKTKDGRTAIYNSKTKQFLRYE